MSNSSIPIFSSRKKLWNDRKGEQNTFSDSQPFGAVNHLQPSTVFQSSNHRPFTGFQSSNHRPSTGFPSSNDQPKGDYDESELFLDVNPRNRSFSRNSMFEENRRYQFDDEAASYRLYNEPCDADTGLDHGYIASNKFQVHQGIGEDPVFRTSPCTGRADENGYNYIDEEQYLQEVMHGLEINSAAEKRWHPDNSNYLHDLDTDDVISPELGILCVTKTVDQYMNRLTTCPKCGNDNHDQIKEVSVDTDHFVKHCADCEHIFGVDDTSSVYEIEEILKTWQINLCECGNKDLENYKIATVEDEHDASLCFMCADCGRKFPLKSNQPGNSEAGSNHGTQSESTGIIISCDKCGNDKPRFFGYSLDEDDNIEGYACHVCDNEALLEDENDYIELDFSKYPVTEKCGNAASVPDTEYCKPSITNDQNVREKGGKKHTGGMGRESISKNTAAWKLKETDHIAWWRPEGYWHHALVSAIFPQTNEVEVIHYNGPSPTGTIKCKGKIVQEVLNLEEEKGAFYRIKYNETCLSIEETLRNAWSRLDEMQYNLLTNNCEHFVRWCKTGKHISGQVCSFSETMARIGVKMAFRAAIKTVKRGVLEFMTRAVFASPAGAELVKDAGKVGAMLLTKKAFNAIGVGAVIAIEGISMAHGIHKGYKQMQRGDINQSEFVRVVVSRSSQAVGGCAGAIAGGALGQLVFPVPVLGGLIGSSLGALLGHGGGYYVGKQICDIGDKTNC